MYYLSLFLLVFLLASCGDTTTKNADSTTAEQPSTAPASDATTTPEAAPTEAPKQVADFVPEGYNILKQVEGDLNLDGVADVALVLKTEQEGTEASLQSCGDILRPLLLLTRDGEGQLTLAMRNDRAVLGEGCGGTFGDPFGGLDVEGGNLTFTFIGGSREQWTTTRTFSYSASGENWELVQDQTEVIDRMSPEAKPSIVDNMKEQPQTWLISYNTYE